MSDQISLQLFGSVGSGWPLQGPLSQRLIPSASTIVTHGRIATSLPTAAVTRLVLAIRSGGLVGCTRSFLRSVHRLGNQKAAPANAEQPEHVGRNIDKGAGLDRKQEIESGDHEGEDEKLESR